MATPRPPLAATFQLPDLVSYCQTFPLHYHKNGDAIAAASDKWFENGCHNFTEKKRRRLNGLKAGNLTAYCYIDCDDDHLRVICDFLNYLFHLDDLSDGMMMKDTTVLTDIVMNALSSPHAYHPIDTKGSGQPKEEPQVSKLARDFWGRCIQDARPGVQARFCESMELYFNTVREQARDRDNGTILDPESYIVVRRGNSGVIPCFHLLEYAFGIELPDFVLNDPIIKILQQTSMDFVSLSNDMFSYNVEQARGDTYNIVCVLMASHGLDLQGAIDHVGEMCRQAVDTFRENQTKIPSWGSEIDRHVASYVHGLEDWIIGALHWSFMSERYFGTQGAHIKKTLQVRLALRRVGANAA